MSTVIEQMKLLEQASAEQTAASQALAQEAKDIINRAAETVNDNYNKKVSLELYVDPINGRDNNDGLSRENALRTIAKAISLGKNVINQAIFLEVGKYDITELTRCLAENVQIVGANQYHYPNGNWSESTSSVININKTSDVRSSITSKLFGNLFR